jgi:transcriptional regulator
VHIIAVMYVPDHFREDRPEVLHDAVRRIGFATLVTQGLEANHLPMLLGDGVLRGHVARANPVWKAGAVRRWRFPGAARLCLAQLVSQQGRDGQSGADLELHHQCTSKARSLDTGRGLGCAPMCRRLATEMRRAGPSPWSINDAPSNYIDSQLRAIVGFELTIAKLEGKYKLSQEPRCRPIRRRARGLAARWPR